MATQRSLVQATVVGVNDGSVLYPCCSQCCAKMLQNVNSSVWQCVRCNIKCTGPQLTWRYRLSLCIADTSAVCGVSLFGGTLVQHFGCGANQFHKFIWGPDCSGQQQVQEETIVQAVQTALVGNTYIFCLKTAASPQDSTCSPAERATFPPYSLADLLSAWPLWQRSDGKLADFIAVQMIRTSMQGASEYRTVVDVLKSWMNGSKDSSFALSEKDMHVEVSCPSSGATKNSLFHLSGERSLVSTSCHCGNSSGPERSAQRLIPRRKRSCRCTGSPVTGRQSHRSRKRSVHSWRTPSDLLQASGNSSCTSRDCTEYSEFGDKPPSVSPHAVDSDALSQNWSSGGPAMFSCQSSMEREFTSGQSMDLSAGRLGELSGHGASSRINQGPAHTSSTWLADTNRNDFFISDFFDDFPSEDCNENEETVMAVEDEEFKTLPKEFKTLPRVEPEPSLNSSCQKRDREASFCTSLDGNSLFLTGLKTGEELSETNHSDQGRVTGNKMFGGKRLESLGVEVCRGCSGLSELPEEAGECDSFQSNAVAYQGKSTASKVPDPIQVSFDTDLPDSEDLSLFLDVMTVERAAANEKPNSGKNAAASETFKGFSQKSTPQQDVSELLTHFHGPTTGDQQTDCNVDQTEARCPSQQTSKAQQKNCLVGQTRTCRSSQQTSKDQKDRSVDQTGVRCILQQTSVRSRQNCGSSPLTEDTTTTPVVHMEENKENISFHLPELIPGTEDEMSPADFFDDRTPSSSVLEEAFPFGNVHVSNLTDQQFSNLAQKRHSSHHCSDKCSPACKSVKLSPDSLLSYNLNQVSTTCMLHNSSTVLVSDEYSNHKKIISERRLSADKFSKLFSHGMYDKTPFGLHLAGKPPESVLKNSLMQLKESVGSSVVDLPDSEDLDAFLCNLVTDTDTDNKTTARKDCHTKSKATDVRTDHHSKATDVGIDHHSKATDVRTDHHSKATDVGIDHHSKATDVRTDHHSKATNVRTDHHSKATDVRRNHHKDNKPADVRKDHKLIDQDHKALAGTISDNFDSAFGEEEWCKENESHRDPKIQSLAHRGVKPENMAATREALRCADSEAEGQESQSHPTKFTTCPLQLPSYFEATSKRKSVLQTSSRCVLQTSSRCAGGVGGPAEGQTDHVSVTVESQVENTDSVLDGSALLFSQDTEDGLHISHETEVLCNFSLDSMYRVFSGHSLSGVSMTDRGSCGDDVRNSMSGMTGREKCDVIGSCLSGTCPSDTAETWTNLDHKPETWTILDHKPETAVLSDRLQDPCGIVDCISSVFTGNDGLLNAEVKVDNSRPEVVSSVSLASGIPDTEQGKKVRFCVRDGVCGVSDIDCRLAQYGSPWWQTPPSLSVETPSHTRQRLCLTRRQPLTPVTMQGQPIPPTATERQVVTSVTTWRQPVIPITTQRQLGTPITSQRQQVTPVIIQRQPVTPVIIQRQPVTPVIIQRQPVTPVIIQRQPVTMVTFSRNLEGRSESVHAERKQQDTRNLRRRVLWAAQKKSSHSEIGMCSTPLSCRITAASQKKSSHSEIGMCSTPLSCRITAASQKASSTCLHSPTRECSALVHHPRHLSNFWESSSSQDLFSSSYEQQDPAVDTQDQQDPEAEPTQDQQDPEAEPTQDHKKTLLSRFFEKESPFCECEKLTVVTVSSPSSDAAGDGCQSQSLLDGSSDLFDDSHNLPTSFTPPKPTQGCHSQPTQHSHHQLVQSSQRQKKATEAVTDRFLKRQYAYNEPVIKFETCDLSSPLSLSPDLFTP